MSEMQLKLPKKLLLGNCKTIVATLLFSLSGLKISFGHGHLSDPFVKLSDVKRNAPDILSDQSKIEDFCLSDPNVLMSDETLTLSDVIFLCKECSYCVK